jgi:hypothetical protein
MLKPEHQGANLVKGIPRNWILEAYDKLLLIIQIFFTCEGRYSRVLQYHFKLLLHFTGKREIDLPYFLFMSLQRMILLAQRKPDKLQKSIFHHALIKLIVIEQLKKEGREWLTFLFVSKYQVDLPISPSKSKTPRKKTVIPSSAPSSEVPQSSQDPIPQEPSPVQVSKRDKRKGKAKEVVIEEQLEPPMELPQMEIEDNAQTIQVKIGTPSLRRSSRRKLVLAEESHQKTEVIKPRTRLSKLKVSPLEKEALEAIVQLRESPSEPSPETVQGPKTNRAQLLKNADRQLKEVQEKNQKLHQENVTLNQQLSSQMDELVEECNQLKRNIRKKVIQRKQLINMYKQNLHLREDNKKLTKDLYLAKNMLSKKNLAIFLKEITSTSSPK